MLWWMWLAAGLALVVMELATPSGFFILFFGLGALTVGTLARLGLVETGWIQWLLFTVLSLVYLLLFRSSLQERLKAPPRASVDTLLGALAVPQDLIAPSAVGRVEVRGSAWSARNVSATTLTPGQRCKVSHVDGLLLSVEPE
jgi:membrane protein implicated in regulation of membrane protease activity